MTKEEIDAKVASIHPITNLIFGGLFGVVAYMIAGSILVNPMGVLLILVGLSLLYFLPPVQRLVRFGLRKLVVRVNA